ncbi:hypothetical protein IU436_25515 [Nocardia farcinica]|uniref:hypothetical protein n=1 Tax=Nocardia farcinica TaxID=37329 RepID=UPI0018950AF8|nr:hypothetical protein [Nocardia farcinica]MBF6422053.1 hypothetical protein [Nocardia farcinica]MBF6433709.1 hypothetical protein [Nocardia farcinica]MBF6504673.1 hypothetical protein [Nocardia farcinica]
MTTNRTRQARQLADWLTERTRTPVTLQYRDCAHRAGRAWHVQWTHGPTPSQMLSLAAAISEERQTLDVAQLYPVRSFSPVGEAAAVLLWLHSDVAHGEQWPGLWASAARQEISYPDQTAERWQRRAAAVLSLATGGWVTTAVCRRIDTVLRSDGWDAVVSWLDQISDQRDPCYSGPIPIRQDW